MDTEFLRILPNTDLVIHIRRLSTKVHQKIVLLAQHQLDMYLAYLTTMEDKVGQYCLRHFGLDRNLTSTETSHDFSAPLYKTSNEVSSVYLKFPFLEPMEAFRNSLFLRRFYLTCLDDPLANNTFKVDFESLLNLIGLFKKLALKNNLVKTLTKHRTNHLDDILKDSLTEKTEKMTGKTGRTAGKTSRDFSFLKVITTKLIGHFRLNVALSTQFPVSLLPIQKVRDDWCTATEKWRLLLLTVPTDNLEIGPVSEDFSSLTEGSLMAMRQLNRSFMASFTYCQYGMLFQEGLVWPMDYLLESDSFLFHLTVNQLRINYSDLFQKVKECIHVSYQFFRNLIDDRI